MPFFPNLNLKLRRRAEEKAPASLRCNSCWLLRALYIPLPPPPPSPLSLCFPITQAFSTITKATDSLFGQIIAALDRIPADSLLGEISAAIERIPDPLFWPLTVALTVVFTSDLLDWNKHWSGNTNVFTIFLSNVLWRLHWSAMTNNVFMMLLSNVSKGLQLFSPWWIRIRDEVAHENRPTIPSELWGEIGKRLPSRLDILCFRSVCKQWRSSLPCPSRFPLEVPFLPNCDPEFRKVPYFISEVNCYSLDRWGKYNLLFEEVDQGGKCYHGTNIFPLLGRFSYPMISFMRTPKHRPPQIYFNSKAFRLRMALPRSNSNKQRLVGGEWDFRYSKFAKKMVLISSSKAHGVNPNYVRLSDLSVVVHMSWGAMKGRLALLRLGGSPENWEWDTDFCTQCFEDIATYRGQLCAVDHLGRVFLMDYNSLEMTLLAPPWSMASEMDNKQLYEADGDLYLLNLSWKSFRCVAYKLSLPLQKWIQVKGRARRLSALLPSLEKEGVQERAENELAP